MMNTTRAAKTLLILLLIAGLVHAAEAPERLNYQGVLRDSGDKPLDGYYDMTFRFWTAASKGDEILIDEHLSHDAVLVTGGLFSVAIGSGAVSDGSGPGIYKTLAAVFRDYQDLWLEVQVGSETLTPRTQLASSGYAFNSTHLGGRPVGDFIDSSGITQAKVGNLIAGAASGTGKDTGVEGYGTYAGGYFEDLTSSGHAWLGRGDYGLDSRGNSAGGYFLNEETGSSAYAAYGSVGLEAHGRSAGGYFLNTGWDTSASIASESVGLEGFGPTTAGHFKNTTYGSEAWVGKRDVGIQAEGSHAGAMFADQDESGFASLGYGDFGIDAVGDLTGGRFKDRTSGVLLYAAYDTSSTWGTGTKNFVQNHPEEPGTIIAYAALEGDEAGTYTRGTGRMSGGVGRVRLGETFKWVTNPDIGLTAQVTARGVAVPLAVRSLSTEELVVEAPPDAPSDLSFDYIVHGLRIGFEGVSMVKPKPEGVEAFIPSMANERKLLAERPELERYTPLSRFAAMRSEIASASDGVLDLARSKELLAAIHEYDPETDGPIVVRDPLGAEQDLAGETADTMESQPGTAPPAPGWDRGRGAALVPEIEEASGAEVAGRPGGQLTETAALPPGLAWLPVAESVEAGDLLALDPAWPGALHRADSIADAGVVGVATASIRPSAAAPGGQEVAVLAMGFCELKADAGFGAIRPGDLLTSSPTAGHAMRALELDAGTILGKALEPLEAGTGKIRVLLLMR